MKKYRGYYIDSVIYRSESEIDEAIKQNAIERYKTLNKLFAKRASVECAALCAEQARYLHDECGLSYEEIEELEIEAIKEAA